MGVPNSKKKKPDYAKIFVTKKDVEEQLKLACPNLEHKSGIYFYTREKLEEGGGFACYIGKSVDVADRCISHQTSWVQRIDISLKSRKYYGKYNLNGWKLNVLYFPKHLLDEKERYYINLYQSKGYEILNIESGGSEGKEDINKRQEGRTYREGVTYGELKAKRQVKVFFDKYLNFEIKQPSNKIKERKYNEFKDWLKGDD